MAEILLRVVQGLHEGASFGLQPGQRCVVGSGPDVRLVLFDDGVEPAHVALELEEGSAAQLRVTALASGVTAAGSALPPGEPRPLSLPVEVRIAAALLRIEQRGDTAAPATPPSAKPEPAPARRPMGRLLPIGVVLAGLLGAMGALGVPMAGLPGTSSPEPVAQVTYVPPVLNRPEPSRAPAALPPALAAFREHLAELGLTEVELSGSGPGVVVARGELDAARLPEWRAAEAWFDRRFAGRILLVNNVRGRTSRAPAIVVEAVWTGPDPNVLIGGQRYFEEAVLPDGWTIERIEPGRLLLRRGTQRVAVAF